jgi:hypothetical protein
MYKVNRSKSQGVSAIFLAIAAALALSVPAVPAAYAKATVIFTDPDPYEHENPDFDIDQVGFTSKGNPYLTVHGTPGGTKSSSPGEILLYFIQVSDGPDLGGDPDRYVITSHSGFEDSTETKDDTKWHAHKIELLNPSEACESELGVELVATEEGKALVTANKIVLRGVSPEIIYEVASSQLNVSNVDGHVCVSGGFNFDLITIPDV